MEETEYAGKRKPKNKTVITIFKFRKIYYTYKTKIRFYLKKKKARMNEIKKLRIS